MGPTFVLNVVKLYAIYLFHKWQINLNQLKLQTHHNFFIFHLFNNSLKKTTGETTQIADTIPLYILYYCMRFFFYVYWLKIVELILLKVAFNTRNHGYLQLVWVSPSLLTIYNVLVLIKVKMNFSIKTLKCFIYLESGVTMVTQRFS
jgi:hypothetical protein